MIRRSSFLVVCTMILAPLFAHAAAPVVEAAPSEGLGRTSFIGSLGLNVFAEEQDLDGQYQVRLSPLFRLGAGLKPGDIFLEYTWFVVSESEGAVSIDRTQRMALLWFRYRFRAIDGNIVPFVGGALGLQNQSVSQSVGASSATSTGHAEFMAAASTGVIWLIGSNIQLDGDLRILGSQTFSPNPTIGATVTLGFRY